jgi:hypothetical protein
MKKNNRVSIEKGVARKSMREIHIDSSYVNFYYFFVNYSTYYARFIVTIMVGASSIGLLVLIRHIKGIKQRKDFKKQTINIDFLFSIMLNLIMSWGGIIGFGRPFSPGCVYLGGLFVVIVLGKILP